MTFNVKYLIFAVSSILLLFSLSILLLFNLSAIDLVYFFPLLLGILLASQWVIYVKINKEFKQQTQNYRQIESLFSIFSLIKPNQVLPPMRGWAISPDLATVIVSLIYEHKPKLIIEASSGISTLLSAYCLKQLGGGQVVSFEDKEKYANISQHNVIKHGLDKIATVIHAPLKDVIISGKKWQWYDTEKIDKNFQIDMLIVDGPQSRYPALPLLFKNLSNNAIVILDDADRKDERRIVDAWMKEFNCFEMERIPNEKGAVILRKKHKYEKGE